MSELHWHHCPECYDHHACELACAIEPDLSEPGHPRGHHTECPTCDPAVFAWESVRELLAGARWILLCCAGRIRATWWTETCDGYRYTVELVDGTCWTAGERRSPLETALLFLETVQAAHGDEAFGETAEAPPTRPVNVRVVERTVHESATYTINYYGMVPFTADEVRRAVEHALPLPEVTQ